MARMAPFAGANAPNVRWPEGSAEMLLAEATAGQSTSSLTQSLNSIAAVTAARRAQADARAFPQLQLICISTV
jgi:hypothetical protein